MYSQRPILWIRGSCWALLRWFDPYPNMDPRALNTHWLIAKTSTWNMLGIHPMAMESWGPALPALMNLDILEPSVCHGIVLHLSSVANMEPFQSALLQRVTLNFFVKFTHFVKPSLGMGASGVSSPKAFICLDEIIFFFHTPLLQQSSIVCTYMLCCMINYYMKGCELQQYFECCGWACAHCHRGADATNSCSFESGSPMEVCIAFDAQAIALYVIIDHGI